MHFGILIVRLQLYKHMEPTDIWWSVGSSISFYDGLFILRNKSFAHPHFEEADIEADHMHFNAILSRRTQKTL